MKLGLVFIAISSGHWKGECF